MKKILIIAAILFSGIMAKAQTEADIWELVKSDLKIEYKAILAQNMNFSEEEAVIFWPIFNEYMTKKGANLDKTMKLLEDYATNYESFTDEKIEELIKASNSQKTERLQNNMHYYKTLKKALGIHKAAKLYQIDGQINTIFDFQIASQVPIIK